MEIKYTPRRKTSYIEELNLNLSTIDKTINETQKHILELNNSTDETDIERKKFFQKKIDAFNNRKNHIQNRINIYNDLSNEEKNDAEQDEIILFNRKYFKVKNGTSNFEHYVTMPIQHDLYYNDMKNIPVLKNNEILPEELVISIIYKDYNDNNELQFDVIGILYNIENQIKNYKEDEFFNKSKEEIINTITNEFVKLF